MRNLLILALVFFIGIETLALSCCNKTKILEIYDGDTVRALVNGQPISIRLIGIDCYETAPINRAYKQAYINKLTIEEVIERGKDSKRELKKLLSKSSDIEVKITGKDKYNRALGVLYVDNLNVNRYMVEKGGCLNYVYKENKKCSR